MKRSMCVLIAAAVAALGLCANPAQANLITNNPSWETGDTSSWTQTFNVFIGPGTVLTDSRALDGTRMLGGSFPDDATNNGYLQYENRTLSQQYAANTIYTFTAHAFTDNPNLTGYLRLLFGVADTDGGTNTGAPVIQDISFSAGSGTVLAPDGITMWNQLSITLDTSAHPAVVGKWIVPVVDVENAYMDLASVVPEPGSVSLLGIGGLLAVAAVVRRRLRS